MADIKVRIEVNPNKENENFGNIVNKNAQLSNVSFKTNSSNVFENLKQIESLGTNGLSWAKTFINSNGKEDSYLIFNEEDFVDNEDLKGGVIESEEEPTEFVWGIVPPNKEYSVKLTFADAKNLKDIIVYGNKTTNQFPTRAILDGKTEIFSDDYRWAINLQTESDTHTIEFTHWNRSDYNAGLTFIAVMMRYWEVSKTGGLKSIESLNQSTGQPKNIFYGVVPSDGSLEIIDIDGEIADMVRDGVIENSNVGFDVLGNGNQVQTHISTDSSYSENEKIFKTTLSNEFSSWKEIYLQETKYSNRFSTLNSIVRDVLEKLGYSSDEINSVMSNTIVYGRKEYSQEKTIEEYLSHIHSKALSIYHDKVTVFSLMEEICSIAQLNLIKKDNGDIRFISARPQRLSTDDAIVIPKKHQFEQPSIDLLIKNKFNNVKYYEHNLTDSFETTLEETIEITYVNDKIDLSSLDLDDVHIYTDENNVSWLRFFKTIVTSSEFSRYDINYPNKDAFDITYEGDEYSSSGLASIYSIDSTKENYDFKYQYAVRLTPYSTLNSDVFAFNIDLPTTKLEKINLILRARVTRLSEVEKYYNDNTNIYEFNYSGKLLTSLFYYNDAYSKESMYNLIAENIVEDYSSGINSTTMTVACADYYDTHNNKVKDWQKGEIFQVGEIVRIDKDNNGNSVWEYNDRQPIYWKIVGRKFRYVGVPLIELQLQQLVYKPFSKPLYKKYRETINGQEVDVFELTKNFATTDMFFTLDGSTPTTKSERYTKPFYIYDDTTTLNIMAINVEGNAKSKVAHYVVSKNSVIVKA